jgi:DNA-binding winged helix-turn-helix (wHTH) protein
MNGRNSQQISMERLPQSCDTIDEGRNGRSDRVQTASVIDAFAFGPFCIIPYARLLERGGSPVPLGGRAFDLLCLLISRPGDIVSKDELMTKIWPNVTVEEANLRFHISVLRRVLGDRQRGARYVINVRGRGYSFVASVSREAWPRRQNHERSMPSLIRPVRADWLLA